MEKSKDKKQDESKDNKIEEGEKKETAETEPNETERKEGNNTNSSSSINNQSKSLKRKVVYLNQKVILPNNFPDRIDYIRSLFDNEELGYIVTYAPNFSSSNTYEIGKYFKSKLKNILEISSGILFYIYKTFQVNRITIKDKEEASEKDCDEILKSGKINSPEEMCLIYKDLCAWGGVKIDIISGALKKYGYKVGDSLVKHKWCLLTVSSDKQFLIDPFLVVGEAKEKEDPNRKFIKPYYFLTPPEFFLENHIPDEEKYQFSKKTITVKEFTKKPQTDTEDFYNSIFKYKIKLQNYPYPEIDCKDSEIIIKFMVDNMELNVECIYNGRKLPEDKVSITDNNYRNKFDAKIIFLGNGEYKLTILGKPVNSVGQLEPFFTYKINTKIVNIIKHEDEKKKSPAKAVVTRLRSGSPQYQKTKIESSLEKQLTKCSSDFDKKIKNKCYDNEGAHLIEPKNKILKIGMETKFRVRIRNAKSVVIIDGRKWNYLKHRDNDLFEGQFVIENESVVLCANRSKNMFTEVFEFLAIKR